MERHEAMNSMAAFDGFGDLAGFTWLNTAHQGPLPLTAAKEAREAVAWKLAPHELTGARFDGIPRPAFGRRSARQ